MKANNPLDFKHIWKRLNNANSSTEDECINDWLQSDPKHSNFYNDAQSYFQKGSQFKHVSNQQTQFRRMWKKIAWRKAYRNLRNGVALIAFILGVYWGINQLMDSSDQTATIE